MGGTNGGVGVGVDVVLADAVEAGVPTGLWDSSTELEDVEEGEGVWLLLPLDGGDIDGVAPCVSEGLLLTVGRGVVGAALTVEGGLTDGTVLPVVVGLTNGTALAVDDGDGLAAITAAGVTVPVGEPPGSRLMTTDALFAVVTNPRKASAYPACTPSVPLTPPVSSALRAPTVYGEVPGGKAMRKGTSIAPADEVRIVDGDNAPDGK